MRALVLSGGSGKGAYQCGSLRYLLGELRVKYSVYCGISVGAINNSFLAQFPEGQEEESIERLTDLWRTMDSSKIYKRHFPFGRLHAIWKQSFFDGQPLHELIKKNIKLDKIRETGKKVSVGTVSLSSGKYTIFDQNSDYFIDAVIASASFPVILPPVKFLDQLWSDGGSKTITPLHTAIDMGADEIDVIMTSPKVRIKRFIEKPGIVDILKRSVDLSADKIMANDLEKVEMYNQLALAGFTNKRYVKINIIRPDFNLIDDVLDFDPVKIREMLEKGYQDAKSQYISNIVDI